MAYWLIYLVTILSHFVVASFHDDGLVPQARTFKSLEDLKDSTFWRNFVMTRNPIIANTTALYIEDTNSVFIFDERVEPAKWKVWLGWKPDVRLTEVSLGAKSDDISIDHFPLVTVSAEHNSDSGSVERELTDGFGIAVSVNSRMSSKLLTVGLKTGLSSVYGVDVTLTEAIICTASKGGKVQMQVSTKVSYFPLAKSRRVDYVERGKIFNFGSWESVSSRIDNEEYEDHQLALVDYVVVYGKVPLGELDPSSVQMIAVDEKSTTLSFKRNSKTEELKLSWNELPEGDKVQVNSIMDIKAKVIAMAKYAASVQGFSHQQLKKVVLPNRPTQVFMYLVAVALALGTVDKYWLRNLISKDVYLSQLVSYTPKILKTWGALFEDHVRTFTIALYAVHLVEIAVVSLPKLNKYRASTWRKLAWAGMHLVEGFLIFPRLNKALEEAH
ncbi:hypothetical protein ACQ2H7_002461 [Candidozyma auris]